MTYTMSDPAGVFGLITPWNGRFMLSTWKMAPCLAYGNCAIHKPSELSPLIIGILCEIFQEAGLPEGVYNMVLGYGQEAGIPLVSKNQYERVMGYIESARQEGRVLFSGARPDGLHKGYYVAPTAVVDIYNSAQACQEEIFGPVAMIMPFDDADGTLRIANDSEYGLTGYIWTDSQTTAHYVSHRLQAAMIWINAGFDRDLRQPFCSIKNSGLGREGGNLSREFYTETRFTSFPLTPR